MEDSSIKERIRRDNRELRLAGKKEYCLEYEQAKELMFSQLDTHKIMALASSEHDHVMVRNVSCLFYDGFIWFKTDRNFRKTRQLFANPRVALCTGGIQVEGTAENMGLVVDEPGRVFEKGYEKYLSGSYNSYSHEDSEIIIRVTPVFAELWDTDEDNCAYQIFIDFKEKKVEFKQYD